MTATAVSTRIALIGIGLIGSSIAHVDPARGPGRAHRRSPRRSADDAEARRRAGARRLATRRPGRGSDGTPTCVILSVPVGASGEVATEIAPALKPGAIVTDVGSTKALGHRPDAAASARRTFISSPAIRSPAPRIPGPDAGFADLFDNRWCIFTPLPGTDPAALEKLAAFWRRCGANVDTMDAEHHDMVLAIATPPAAPHRLQHRRHGRRSGDGDQVGGDQIFGRRLPRLHPHRRLRPDHVARRLPAQQGCDARDAGRFTEDLASLQRAIRWGDGDKLFDLFTRTRAIRRSIIEAGQEIDAPDFGRQAVEHPGPAQSNKS